MPAPVLVRLVSREVVQVEVALDGLGPEEVVGVTLLHREVLLVPVFGLEVADLWTEEGRLPVMWLICKLVMILATKMY